MIFGILMGCIEARTVFTVIQVVMTYDQCLGVTSVQVFEQSSHGSLLFSRPRIGGLTADIQPALVADAYRVGVVVHAVGTDHPFRTAWLYRSVLRIIKKTHTCF